MPRKRLPPFPQRLHPNVEPLALLAPWANTRGMTVAAQEACLLRNVLATLAGEHDPLARLAPAFFEGAHALTDTPWAVANMDFVFPQTRGQRPADLANTFKFGTALNRLAAQDPGIHELMVEVQMLLKPRSVYRDPELMRRIIAVISKSQASS